METVFESVSFGGIDWLVLERQADMIMVVSKDIVEKRQYHTSNTTITWADCSLRKYLNDDFYNSFSQKDRERIVQTTIKNENNQWRQTNGGDSTTDSIFIPSIAEVVKYFGDSGQLTNNLPTTDWICDKYNLNRIALFNGVPTVWWLRSPGYLSFWVSSVINDGYIYMSGAHINLFDNNIGVRPALWLKA